MQAPPSAEGSAPTVAPASLPELKRPDLSQLHLPVPAPIRAIDAALGYGRQRLALVVGVGTIGRQPVLPASSRDVQAVAMALRRGGFVVMQREDPARADLLAALHEFHDRLQPGGVGFVYLTGLGVQVDGHNLLLPRDAPLEARVDAPLAAAEGAALAPPEQARRLAAAGVPLAAAVDALIGPVGSPRMLVVDAAFQQSALAALPAPGLAAEPLPIGEMVLFSSALGAVRPLPAVAPLPPASDDPRRIAGSPFARALVEALLAPHAKGPGALRATRQALVASSQGQDDPWLAGDTDDKEDLAEASLLDGVVPQSPEDLAREAVQQAARAALRHDGATGAADGAGPDGGSTALGSDNGTSAAGGAGTSTPNPGSAAGLSGTPAPPPPANAGNGSHQADATPAGSGLGQAIAVAGTVAGVAGSLTAAAANAAATQALVSAAAAGPAIGVAGAAGAAATVAGGAASLLSGAAAAGGSLALGGDGLRQMASAGHGAGSATPGPATGTTASVAATPATVATGPASLPSPADRAVPAGAMPATGLPAAAAVAGLPVPAPPQAGSTLALAAAAGASALPQRRSNAGSRSDQPSLPTDGRTERETGGGERPVYHPRANPFGYAEGDTYSYRTIDRWTGEVSGRSTTAIEEVLDNGQMLANGQRMALDAQGRLLRQLNADGSVSRFTPCQDLWWARPARGQRHAIDFTETFEGAERGRGEIEWSGSASVGRAQRISLPAGDFDVLPIESSGWWTQRLRAGGVRSSGRWERTVWWAPSLGHPVAIDIEDTDAQGKLARRERVELLFAQTSRSPH